jgi:hypothetical protein
LNGIFTNHAAAWSTLSAVADRLGVKPMRVALAWLLHRSPNILLIPGTSSVTHLRENLAAAQLARSPQVLPELDGIAPAAVEKKQWCFPLSGTVARIKNRTEETEGGAELPLSPNFGLLNSSSVPSV